MDPVSAAHPNILRCNSALGSCYSAKTNKIYSKLFHLTFWWSACKWREWLACINKMVAIYLHPWMTTFGNLNGKDCQNIQRSFSHLWYFWDIFETFYGWVRSRMVMCPWTRSFMRAKFKSRKSAESFVQFLGFVILWRVHHRKRWKRDHGAE